MVPTGRIETADTGFFRPVLYHPPLISPSPSPRLRVAHLATNPSSPLPPPPLRTPAADQPPQPLACREWPGATRGKLC